MTDFERPILLNYGTRAIFGDTCLCQDAILLEELCHAEFHAPILSCENVESDQSKVKDWRDRNEFHLHLRLVNLSVHCPKSLHVQCRS